MMNLAVKHKSTIGITLACSSAIATGTFGLFIRYFEQVGISEDGVTLMTPFFSFLGFLVVGLIINPKAFILKKKIHWFTVIVCGGLITLPLYNFCYVQAFSNLPLAVASLLHFCNAIVLVFLMRLFFKQKITKEKLICCCIAIVGLLLVLQIFSPSQGGDSLTTIGIIWGIALAVSLALNYVADYFNVNIAEISWIHYTAYAGLVATILQSILYYSPLSLLNELTASASTNGIMVWIVTGIYLLDIMISYGAVAASYNYVDASISALTFVLEPSVGAILGFLVFSETLSFMQLIGIVIAVAAIIYMQYAEGKREQRELLLQKQMVTPRLSPEKE
ncbi:EamA family transporter [Eubacterium sp.]|uniref:EamA family transporter n=1 Tax=Eubacterium sp. TaxID=142586 RepID=UPI002FC98B96